MKKVVITLMALLTLALLAGCSAPETPEPLPEGMDQATLLAQGEQVSDLLFAQDYQAVYDLLREDIRSALTVEDIEERLAPKVEEAGAKEGVKETHTFGDTATEPHGIARIMYDCADRDLQVSLAFDPEMELIGLEAELQFGGFKFSNIGKNLSNLFQ